MMALQKDGAAKVATRIPRNYFDSAGRLVNGYTSQYASISPTRLAYVYHISPTNKTGIEFYNVDTSTLPGEVVREVTRYPTEVDFIPGSANEIAFGPNRFIFASYNAVGVRVVFFDDLGPGNGVGFTTSETFGSDPFDPQSIAVVDDSTFLLAYHGITTNNPDHQARVVVGRADGTFGVPASLGTEHRTTNPHVAVVNDNTAAVVYLETPSLTGDSVTQLRLVAIGADSSVELGEIASEALIVAPIGIAPLTTDLFVVLLNDDGDRILQLWTNADGALGMIGELNLRASQFGNALSVEQLSDSKFMVFSSFGAVFIDTEPVPAVLRLLDTVDYRYQYDAGSQSFLATEVLVATDRDFGLIRGAIAKGVPLVGQASDEILLGISAADTTSGEECPVIIRGVADVFTGLEVGTVYYVAADGSLTTTPTIARLGVAISDKALLLQSERRDAFY